MSMTPREEHLLGDVFLPEIMREAKVTADRMICRDLLGVLIVIRDTPWKEQQNDV